MSKKNQGRIIPLSKSKEVINRSRKTDLTIEEVKACSTFKNISDQQAEEVIEVVKKLAHIAIELYENQLVMLEKSKNGATFVSEEKDHFQKNKKQAA